MLSPYSSLPSDDNVVSGAISTGGGLPFRSLSGDSTPDSVYVRNCTAIAIEFDLQLSLLKLETVINDLLVSQIHLLGTV